MSHCDFLRRFFFRNCCRAVAARRKRDLRRVIECACVNARADGHGGNDFSSFSVEHRHQFVVTAHEQPVMRRVECHSSRFRARRERPARDDFMLCRVDGRDFAFVFDIAVNAAGSTIDNRKLRAAAKRDRADHACRFCIDYRDRISAVIENINLVTTRFVNERVGIRAGLYFRNRAERL